METVYTYQSTKTSMFFQVIECRYKYLVRTVNTFWTEEWVNACFPVVRATWLYNTYQTVASICL